MPKRNLMLEKWFLTTSCNSSAARDQGRFKFLTLPWECVPSKMTVLRGIRGARGPNSHCPNQLEIAFAGVQMADKSSATTTKTRQSAGDQLARQAKVLQQAGRSLVAGESHDTLDHWDSKGQIAYQESDGFVNVPEKGPLPNTPPDRELPSLGAAWIFGTDRNREDEMAAKKKPPSKEELSRAGRDLQNPRTRETRESEAARTLRQGQKKK